MNGLTFPLAGERHLETAESILDDWAAILAESGRDRDAGDVLRVKAALLRLRCSFLESEKAP